MKPREGDPFDSFPKNFWQEFSSPFTDTPEENEIEDGEETTTHEPFPYFDEPSSSVNVTTHLGNSVYLHCRVNENSLNGKTVSILYYLPFYPLSSSSSTAIVCQNVCDYLFYVRIILTSKIHQCGTAFGHILNNGEMSMCILENKQQDSTKLKFTMKNNIQPLKALDTNRLGLVATEWKPKIVRKKTRKTHQLRQQHQRQQ